MTGDNIPGIIHPKKPICGMCGLEHGIGRHLNPVHCIHDLQKMVGGLRKYVAMIELGRSRDLQALASFRTALYAAVIHCGEEGRLTIPRGVIEGAPKLIGVDSEKQEDGTFVLVAMDLTEDPPAPAGPAREGSA